MGDVVFWELILRATTVVGYVSVRFVNMSWIMPSVELGQAATADCASSCSNAGLNTYHRARRTCKDFMKQPVTYCAPNEETHSKITVMRLLISYCSFIKRLPRGYGGIRGDTGGYWGRPCAVLGILGLPWIRHAHK